MTTSQRIKPWMFALILPVVFAGGFLLGWSLGKRSQDALSPSEEVGAASSPSDVSSATTPISDTLSSSPDVGQPTLPDVAGSGTQAEPGGAAPQAEPASTVSMPYVIGIGVLALALVGIAVYFWIIQPRKKHQVLLQALDAIARDSPEDLIEAERLLDAALISGLSSKDIAEARFALGYVRARLGKDSEAAAVVADLRAAGNEDRETLYLDLWLQSRLENHDAVERIFTEYQDRLQDLLDSNLIASITFYERARRHLTRREIGGAFAYYKKVRELDVEALVERIPQRIEDQQVVLGIMALFDRQFDEARKHFEGLRTTAQEKGAPAEHSELGILLCDWRTGRGVEVEARLEDLLPTLKAAVGQNQATAEGARSRRNGEDVVLDEDARLLRNVLLWHAVTRITVWQRLPAGDGLPTDEYRTLNERLDQVKEVDPEMSDSYLIGGLVDYYFGDTVDARKAAVELLDLATEKGVNLADVLVLIERERKLEEFYRDSLRRCLEIVRNYLENPRVPDELRRQLKEDLQPFSRFEQVGDVEIRPGEYDQAPTLEDLQHRIALLRSRIERLIKPRLSEADPESAGDVVESVESIAEITKELGSKKDELEKAEYKLLATTGEFFLKEETPATPLETASQ